MPEDKALSGADGGKYPPRAERLELLRLLGNWGRWCGGAAGEAPTAPLGMGRRRRRCRRPPGQAGKGRARGRILFTELRTCIFQGSGSEEAPLSEDRSLWPLW